MAASQHLRLAPLVAAPLLAAGVWLAVRADTAAPASTPTSGPPLVAATGRVHVVGPSGPPRVDTGRRDVHGAPVTVACDTCHATRAPDPTQRSAEHLTDFHQGLTYAHGGQSCLSCHDPGDYDRLRLADGSSLPFTSVIDLCSQCHGPQRRDFDHGAHGGMNGHWDLSAGDRVRRACTACHDPHAPAFGAVAPVFPPVDAYRARGRSHD